MDQMTQTRTHPHIHTHTHTNTHNKQADTKILQSDHRRSLGGNPDAPPSQKNRGTPIMHLSVFTTFSHPQIWVCPPNIFNKSTPVCLTNSHKHDYRHAVDLLR